MATQTSPLKKAAAIGSTVLLILFGTLVVAAKALAPVAKVLPDAVEIFGSAEETRTVSIPIPGCSGSQVDTQPATPGCQTIGAPITGTPGDACPPGVVDAQFTVPGCQRF